MSASAIRGRYLALTALRWLPVGAVAPLLILTMTERGIDFPTSVDDADPNGMLADPDDPRLAAAAEACDPLLQGASGLSPFSEEPGPAQENSDEHGAN